MREILLIVPVVMLAAPWVVAVSKDETMRVVMIRSDRASLIDLYRTLMPNAEVRRVMENGEHVPVPPTVIPGLGRPWQGSDVA